MQRNLCAKCIHLPKAIYLYLIVLIRVISVIRG
jgi:hypothetical protein